jgi:predicted ATP-grasp superfamily ATP-dependent carboligase
LLSLGMTNLLLLGASIRAAAHSAKRANFRPWGADLFLDADLPLAGSSFRRIEEFRDFLAISDSGPPGPWMYTGALENRPGLVEKITRHRLLWGTSPEVLRQVRNPFAMFKVLTAANIPCPRLTPANCADSVRWLQKPKASAGGKGIAPWNGQRIPHGHYLQENIEGESCAAVFVAAQGRTELLGVTRQLVGQSWLHAGPFQYCGSIGPASLDPEVRKSFLRLGNALAAGFPLQGLFGVDCVLREGIPWPVEVNPRYTASVEVLELATGASALLEHARVFDSSLGSNPRREHSNSSPRILGKAILFARAPLNFPEEGPWRQDLSPKEDFWAMPTYSDIPDPGQAIPARQPIMTVWARDQTPAGCLNQLQRLAGDLDRLLYPP